ncbi:MAG TPA: hypothetical protein VHX65_16905 [Pirellulales bacterium]|nr:hypothetical protein [Pirellulales bacterium]
MANPEKPIRRSHRVVVDDWAGLHAGSARGPYGYPGKYSGFISQKEIKEISQALGGFFRKLPGGMRPTTADEEAAALRDKTYERELSADLVGWVDGPHSVSSTWCVSIGYFVARGERGIAIKFKSGAICFYPNTSTVLYRSLEAAGSKGKFVRQFLAHVGYIIVG